MVRLSSGSDPGAVAERIYEQLNQIEGMTYDAKVLDRNEFLDADLKTIQDAFHEHALENGLTEFLLAVNEICFIFGARPPANQLYEQLKQREAKIKADKPYYSDVEVLCQDVGFDPQELD